MKSELEKVQIKVKVVENENGREGVDFLIGDKQLHLQSIDLDTSQRSIKIKKQDLGELNDNLFIALVLIIDKRPKVVYIIPSKELSQSDSNIFINNEVSLMPSLSNWEIKVSSNTIPELAKYALENMIDKLKS
ncbi:hypothetical protein [Tenacibaculum insulae]|uniref:hypothetical protein n=1 Tax=Tenacibaculum insulae TaxID=2029677 RepID=UPI003AB1C728